MVNLREHAQSLVAPGKGILAADESVSTAGKRLAQIGLENTAENRCAMRHMLFTTPGLKQNISGVILFEETLNQQTEEGEYLRDILAAQGIARGIKVDLGLKPYAEGVEGEQATQGLEGLATRLQNYAELGATFAKWREVYTISATTPSDAHIAASSERLAAYAKLCQQHGLVPIVEPEVLMTGTHDIDQCAEVTLKVHTAVFKALAAQGVDLAAMLLKPNMVIAGEKGAQATTEDVAARTLDVLKQTVPAHVAGVVFLSGGQTPEQATTHLWQMNLQATPWPLSYSFGRALQQEALTTWHGKAENVAKAQAIMALRAEKCGMATYGKS